MQMMQLRVNVYERSGKLHSYTTVEHKNIPVTSPAFRQCLRDNVFFDIEDGYVVVHDTPAGEGFHAYLFRIRELLSPVTP